MQYGRQREGLGPDLRGRRAQRVGGLQRMAALHAEPARTALSHVDVELADDRPHRREVFLELYRHAAPTHGAATTGALRRQRRPEPLVHLSRGLAMRGAPIRRTRLPARTFGRRVGGPFENGAAWRKPARCAAASRPSKRSIFCRSRCCSLRYRVRSRSNRARSCTHRARSRSNRARSSSKRSISRRCRSISASCRSILSISFVREAVCQQACTPRL